MTYLSWGAFYEGTSDQAYFDLLIPRLIEDIVMVRGTRNITIPSAPAIRLRRGSVDKVAKEACSARDTFHLIFIHADTGGRGLALGLDERSIRYCQAIYELCCWPLARCITIAPRHETEAWVLADPNAVTAALGYRGSANSIGLPSDANQAERLRDPKQTLAAAVTGVRGRRRPFDANQMFPAIAQRQSLPDLRRAESFAAFEKDVVVALADLGCI
jgi:hypothetical protein